MNPVPSSSGALGPRGLLCGLSRLEMLVRRAEVALGQRRALARLALPGRRAAARDAAVERAGLDLLLDEGRRGVDAFLHDPRHLGLRRDREVATNVLEKGLIRLGEVLGVSCQP